MSNRQNQVFAEMVAFLGGQIKTSAPIARETRITRDLGLDSLASMNLLMSLEDHFDVSIPLNALPDLETIGDLAAFIDRTKSTAART